MTEVFAAVNRPTNYAIEKRAARKPKPYERAAYPGQKIQIDVKFVPNYCVSNGQKYYGSTAQLAAHAFAVLTRCRARTLYLQHIFRHLARKILLHNRTTIFQFTSKNTRRRGFSTGECFFVFGKNEQRRSCYSKFG